MLKIIAVKERNNKYSKKFKCFHNVQYLNYQVSGNCDSEMYPMITIGRIKLYTNKKIENKTELNEMKEKIKKELNQKHLKIMSIITEISE
jgi:amino acid permease